MVERRNAAQALEVTPDIKKFIASGVKPAGDTVEAKPSKERQPGREAEQSKPKRPAASSERRGAKRQREASRAGEPQQLTGVYAKARIQKSIRFFPKLISEFEHYCRQEEQAGRKPPSLQDAQNEALELWLSKNAQ